MTPARYWQTARVAWALIMGFASSVVLAPIALLAALIEASGTVAAGLAGFGSAVWIYFIARGALCDVHIDGGCVTVRNPWRTYRLLRDEIEAVTMAQPGSMKGNPCLAFRVAGRHRPVPACALTALTTRQWVQLAAIGGAFAKVLNVRTEAALNHLRMA